MSWSRPTRSPTLRRPRRCACSGGAPVITDGPLAEAKEHFGGYLIVDCETHRARGGDRRGWPSSRFAPLEVRPIMDIGGVEM